jgi:hypothetical protein
MVMTNEYDDDQWVHDYNKMEHFMYQPYGDEQ